MFFSFLQCRLTQKEVARIETTRYAWDKPMKLNKITERLEQMFPSHTHYISVSHHCKSLPLRLSLVLHAAWLTPEITRVTRVNPRNLSRGDPPRNTARASRSPTRFDRYLRENGEVVLWGILVREPELIGELDRDSLLGRCFFWGLGQYTLIGCHTCLLNKHVIVW